MAIADVLFLPWPSWAKLAFVLGGLLVVVGSIAGIVKIMKWRRLLRLEKEAEARAERGEMTKTAVISLPFGIMALNDDSSVEGVWNARTATPLHGPRSKNSSPLFEPLRKVKRSKRDTSVSSIPSLDIGEPSSATAAVPRGPIPPHDDLVDAFEARLSRRKNTNSITISYSGPSWRSRPTASPSGPEAQNLLPDSSRPTSRSTPDTEIPKMKLRVSPHRTSSARRFVIGGRNNSVESDDTRRADHTDIIRRMEAHRRLHSAESGQLIPRTRPRSEDNAVANSDYCSCDESDDSAMNVRTVSWPATENIKTGKLPQKVITISQQPARPKVAAVVENRPPSKPCPSAWTSRTQGLLEEKVMRQVSLATTVDTAPALCSDTTYSTVTNIESSPIENKFTRKVNAGFEILPAGTFAKEPNVEVLSLWPDILESEEPSRKKPKKLQKHKRKSSVNSQSSRGSSESQRSGRFALMHTVY